VVVLILMRSSPLRESGDVRTRWHPAPDVSIVFDNVIDSWTVSG
jgi:hypothetical protein